MDSGQAPVFLCRQEGFLNVPPPPPNTRKLPKSEMVHSILDAAGQLSTPDIDVPV